MTFVIGAPLVSQARFFLPVALLKHAIDAMVQTKLNVLHLHLTDSESFPLVLKSRTAFAQVQGKSWPAAAPCAPVLPIPRGKIHTRGNTWSFTVV